MKLTAEYDAFVFVTFWCYNIIPHTESFIQNRDLFLTLLKAWKSKIKIKMPCSWKSALQGTFREARGYVPGSPRSLSAQCRPACHCRVKWLCSLGAFITQCSAQWDWQLQARFLNQTAERMDLLVIISASLVDGPRSLALILWACPMQCGA